MDSSKSAIDTLGVALWIIRILDKSLKFSGSTLADYPVQFGIKDLPHQRKGQGERTYGPKQIFGALRGHYYAVTYLNPAKMKEFNMIKDKLIRVSHNNPCPVCGKPDWCLVAPDGSAAICQRIEDGSEKECGEAGWLHILDERQKPNRDRTRRISIPLNESPPPDFSSLAKKCRGNLQGPRLEKISRELGVTQDSLRRLGIGWNGTGFTFPMRNPKGDVIGLRIRYPNGRKICAKGSHLGLFIPSDLPHDGLLLICEGCSDTAAALDLGFAAVGRPSCKTGSRMLSKFASGRDVVIVSDNDEPGREGAENLASDLVLHCQSVKIIYPPVGIKDLRQWKQAHLTYKQLMKIVHSTPVLKVELSVRKK